MTDHLGNVVVLFEDKNGDGKISMEEETGGVDNGTDNANNEVLQRNFYSSFGMKMQGSWEEAQLNPEQHYLYNGKEANPELGLNWLSFGFREYDPAIARFPSVDPIADNFAHVSGFNYSENSPIANIDLWGLQKGSVNSLDPFLSSASQKDKEAYYKGFTEAGKTAADYISDELLIIGEGKAIAQGDYWGVAIGSIPLFGTLINNWRKYRRRVKRGLKGGTGSGKKVLQNGWSVLTPKEQLKTKGGGKKKTEKIERYMSEEEADLSVDANGLVPNKVPHQNNPKWIAVDGTRDRKTGLRLNKKIRIKLFLR